MRNNPLLFRVSAAAAITGTMLGALTPRTGMAQEATATATATAASGGAATDPPVRVGRLSRLDGTVSFHTADADHWDPASLNYPVTSGDAFWTEPNAVAQIEVGATHIALDQQTEFDIDTLDDTQLAATEAQGALYLHVGYVAQGDTYTLRTPRGTVTIAALGRYEIAAGDSDRPTTVTVIEGSAQVTGDNLSLAVGPHQTATITGATQFQGSVGAEADDPFLTAQLAAERAPRQPAVATNAASATATAQATASASASAQAYQPPPVVQQMTGSEELATTGSWDDAPQYGHVWYPPVQHDWVPYRDGHWSYVAPWGWTWVDNSSWGFAPFHYGRWVEVNDRWGWTPVAPDAPYEERPCYSPALVDFVGVAAGAAVGAAVGVGIGLALGGGGGYGRGGDVGWVPLGFHEAYVPPYQASAGYINRINSPNFNRNENITKIVDQRRSFVNNGTINRNSGNTTNNVTNNYYSNARAATIAPAAALQSSAPIAPVARKVTAQQFAEVARPAARPPTPTAQDAWADPGGGAPVQH